jgi:hypothetical protein
MRGGEKGAPSGLRPPALASSDRSPHTRPSSPRGGSAYLCHIHRLGRSTGGGGHRVHGSLQTSAAATRTPPPVAEAGWEFVHIAVDDHSRLASATWSRTKRPRPRSPSLATGSPASPVTGSASSGSSQTTAAPTSRPCTRSPARDSRSVAYARPPRRTQRAGKAEPFIRIVPFSPAGLRRPATAQAANAPQPLTAGSGTSTIDDRTQPPTPVTRTHLLGSYNC